MKTLLFFLFISLLPIAGFANDPVLIRDSSVNNGPNDTYGLLTCETADGQIGCYCTVMPDMDDCSIETNCVLNSQLSNYYTVLMDMYSPDEIGIRASNNVRITESALIAALKKDGFPVK